MKPYKPSELAVQMMEYLDCPCEVFGPMDDDDALWTAYQLSLIHISKLFFAFSASSRV